MVRAFMKKHTLCFMLLMLQGAWVFGEDPRKLGQEDTQRTMVTIDRAKKAFEAEQYRLEKQAELERLRNNPKTPNWLQELKEGPKTKKENLKEETPQEKFLKEKLKGSQEKQVEPEKDKAEEKKKLEEVKKKQETPLPLTPPVETLAEEENKKKDFYQTRLLVNYRSAEQVFLKKKLSNRETEEAWEESVRKREASAEEILDNIPFLREMSLDPYAFESDVWEP
jgi:hypothetical protein